MTHTSQKPYRLSMKVLIQDDQGRRLFIKRSQASQNNKGKWDLPGGKVDPGEDFDKALLREVMEETGLSIAICDTAGAIETDLVDRKLVHLIMEGRHVAGEVVLSEEHDDFAWVGPHRLADLDICEQFRKFLAEYFQ